MTDAACPTREELTHFVCGENNVAADDVAAHLDDCSRCREVVQDLWESAAPIGRHAGKRLFQHCREDEFQHVVSSLRDLASASVSHNDRQLSRLGDYEILEQIGRGGMGTVYKARHTKLNRLVALKVLSADRLRDNGAVVRFQREMAAVGQLDHSNVVSGLDAGEVESEHFLAMELLDGVSLSDLLAGRDQLTVADACEIIRQACLGLHHAHNAGVIHRDIKPSNLLLCRNRHDPPLVKILDMGLARFNELHQPSDPATATGQMMGTLEFMAPEQGLASADIDRRADVYSVGATLFRLLSGRMPYDRDRYDTPVRLMQALANETPDSVGKYRILPQELVALIDRMLSRRPADRPGTLQEVAAALEPFAQGHDLSALLANDVRTLGDVNGDGKADIVAFGESAVGVSLSAGGSFEERKVWNNDARFNWTATRQYREIHDVNGDGKDDIMAGTGGTIACALSDGSSFGEFTELLHDAFDPEDHNPAAHITFGDIDGNNRADIFSSLVSTFPPNWRRAIGSFSLAKFLDSLMDGTSRHHATLPTSTVTAKQTWSDSPIR